VSTIIDVAEETTTRVPGVRQVLAYRSYNDAPAYYLWLDSGEAWYAYHRIEIAEPLVVALSYLLAVRGSRWVFADRSIDTIYIHDVRDRSWRWWSYRLGARKRSATVRPR
jgi:hypothetical protein